MCERKLLCNVRVIVSTAVNFRKGQCFESMIRITTHDSHQLLSNCYIKCSIIRIFAG